MDLATLLAEKKKKAMENNKLNPKNTKMKANNNNKSQMPMRKAGRGK
mgnify:CR=1 FL=1